MAKKTKKPAKVVKKAKKPAAAKPAKKAAAPAKKVAKPAAKKPAVAKKAAAPAAKAPKVTAKGAAKPIPEKVAKKEKAAAKGKTPVEAVEAAETAEAAEEAATEEEVVLTDAEGRRYCRVKDCDQLASVDGYCRYHYLLYWKKIQVRKKILTEGKLERYIEELTARYPDKFLEMLRKDLRSEKEFLAAIQELEIDESTQEGEFEEDTGYIEEVRGMGEPSGTREEEDF